MTIFPHLTSPLSIGAHTLPNRIVSTAHGEQMGSAGLISQELIDYHTRRAMGGAGMLVAFGSGTVHPAADNDGNVSLWDPRNEPALRTMAQQVRSEGTVLLAQATHRGPREAPTSSDAYTSAPSAMIGPFAQGSPHVLQRQEIEQIVRNYAAAAARLARCGFSGVEITGLGSHLIELFWSPTLNTRNDRYGGSSTNRLRFVREIIQSISDAVPNDFLLGFRMSLDPQSPSLGLNTDDLLQILSQIDALGRVDLFSISGGSGATIETHAGNVPTEAYPPATYADLAEQARRAVNTPVTVAGRILTAEMAEKTLNRGQADMVGLTRALIADPNLPKHALAGTPERTKPCIAINEGCRRVTFGEKLACTVNPVIADPQLAHPNPVIRPRRVAVVGGGPGGMEASRVAASRGHNVTLFEKGSLLGGQVNIAAREAGRPYLLRHVEWSQRELHRLGVTVRTHSEIFADELVTSEYEAIVIATGSEATTPEELRDRVRTTTDTDILQGHWDGVDDQTTLTVLDAQSYRRGAAIASYLGESHQGKVRLVTPALEQMAHLENPSKPPLLRRLAASGVELLTSYELAHLEFGPRLQHMWSNHQIDLGAQDLVVAVGWTDPSGQLEGQLRTQAPDRSLFVIGDAQAPRRMRNAISEGARVGTQL